MDITLHVVVEFSHVRGAKEDILQITAALVLRQRKYEADGVDIVVQKCPLRLIQCISKMHTL